MVTERKLMTADELLLMPRDGKRYELIRGVLSEKVAPGYSHSVVSGTFGGILFIYTDTTGNGRVVVEPHYRLERNPDLVRAPDVAWIAPGRIPEETAGYPEVAPDLAIEVKSPSNSYAELEDKAAMWLAHGSQQVWMADAARVSVTIYRPGAPPVILSENDILDGGDLLPGFTCPVWRFFRRER